MENKHIFNSYGFNIALAILLLNDFILKGLYGNWLTGKLSDFAGLFVFSLFFMAFFPKHRQIVLYATGILFIFWKSPFSQPSINFWNNLSIFSIQRVVDYADLFALLMLPLAGLYSKTVSKVPALKFNPILPMLVACFACVATSYHSNVKVDKTYIYPFSKDSLETLINNKLIDSVYADFKPDSLATNPDTIRLKVLSDFCFHDLKAYVSIFETREKNVQVKLLSITHRCPAKKRDKPRLIEELERTVFNQLRR